MGSKARRLSARGMSLRGLLFFRCRRSRHIPTRRLNRDLQTTASPSTAGRGGRRNRCNAGRPGRASPCGHGLVPRCRARSAAESLPAVIGHGPIRSRRPWARPRRAGSPHRKLPRFRFSPSDAVQNPKTFRWAPGDALQTRRAFRFPPSSQGVTDPAFRCKPSSQGVTDPAFRCKPSSQGVTDPAFRCEPSSHGVTDPAFPRRPVSRNITA